MSPKSLLGSINLVIQEFAQNSATGFCTRAIFLTMIANESKYPMDLQNYIVMLTRRNYLHCMRMGPNYVYEA